MEDEVEVERDVQACTACGRVYPFLEFVDTKSYKGHRGSKSMTCENVVTKIRRTCQKCRNRKRENHRNSSAFYKKNTHLEKGCLDRDEVMMILDSL